MTAFHRAVIRLFPIAGLLLAATGSAAGADPGLHDVFDPDTDLIFEHLTVDDGLPENSVRAMIQDQHGFLWLGTQNGLVRYDGSSMVVHLPVAADSTSFGGRTIDALHEAADGTLWIGTLLRGLWSYDAQRGTFRAIAGGRGQGKEAAAFHVADIAEDGMGRLWLATEHGLASLEPGAGVLDWPEIEPALPGARREHPYMSVLVDDEGRVWSGTEGGGLLLFEPGTGASRWFLPNPGQPRSLPHVAVRDISQSPDGRIWFATDGGLALWQEVSRDFQVYRLESGLQDENRIFISMVHDSRGVAWLGTIGGVIAFAPDTGRFRVFLHDPERAHSPTNGPFLSMLVDRSGLIWAGTWRAGLDKVDPAAGRFHLQSFSMASGPPSGANVEALMLSRRGDLYVGLSDTPRGHGRGRVFRREGPEGSFVGLENGDTENRTLPSVVGFGEGTDGTIWVATWQGLWRVDGNRVVPVAMGGSPEAELLRRTAVKAVESDRRGRLWLATADGAYRLDADGRNPVHYRHDPTDPASLGSKSMVTIHVDAADRVWFGSDSRGLDLYLGEEEGFRRFYDPAMGLETVADIHEAGDGTLWLGTYSGLVHFDPATGTTRVLDRRHGLPSDEVTAVLGDARRRLWLSTGYGLVCYDPVAGTIQAFDRRDGLPHNEAMFARVIDGNGWLRFGGDGGLVSFDADRFVISDFQPAVFVTGIDLSDRPLVPGADSPLAEMPHLASSLRLGHDRNDLGFAFASLDFARPARVRYRYKLEGADENWRVPGAEPRADYINLRPGNYTFRVQGSNRDGIISSHEATLAVRIDNPWWRTWWANVLYGLTALLLAWAVFRQLTLRERMRARFAVQQAEAEQLQEIDELKTRFLTNITHEFRTPLTLIKVPLIKLREQWEGAPVEQLDTMIRNADRLEQLIDQLLDLSRLEAGRLPLHWQHGDCLSFLGHYASAFESLAAQREIEFLVRIPEDPCEAWYDADLLEKLVGNLLTNAVKHTPDGGQIVAAVLAGPERGLTLPRSGSAEIHGSVPARDLVIAVTNSGSYIPPEDHDRVFDRFYQASTASGSGVGLSLVKELTEWLGGGIDVASDPDRGTCFTVTLPVFLDHPEGLEVESAAAATAEAETHTLDEDEDDVESDGEPRILIVEDNRDLLRFMADDLADEYQVLTADNGEAGLETAIAEIPDLVLSDVMMPGMDGFELCRRLKEDERTSHVPVILLTARSESESRREGLRLGADDYLAKPFDAKDLRLRIRNLIEQRRKLAERYERKLAVLSPDVMPITSADERFVVQLRKIIDGNLDDTDFKINELCHEVGMSRSQLHRKLKAVTGKSTSDFVRTHRLQRAAQLIEGGYGNVTEVAYAVGFRNLSYFARSYRELYGMLPSEALRGQGEADESADDS